MPILTTMRGRASFSQIPCWDCECRGSVPQRRIQKTPCEAKLSHWAEVPPQGQPKAAAAWRRMLHAHTVYKLPPVLRAVHGRWRERRGRGMTRRACEEESPPAGVLGPTRGQWLGDGASIRPVAERTANLDPVYLKCGDGLLGLFCSSTCWPGLTRTSLSWVEDPTHAARHSTGDCVRGELPPPSGDHRQLRQTAEGERQQRGERETQKGPRGVVSRASSSINREGRRERVAVACANGAMQARDSSTRQRIKALLHVQSISLCSVSPPPPSRPPPPPPRWRPWLGRYVREGTRPTGQALLAGCLATMCGYGEM